MAAGATPLDPDEAAGLVPGHIATREQLEDAKAQLAGNSAPLDEIAARFHHRLVWIHPFPNGNGRHARLITDLLLAANGAEPVTWGRGDLEHAGGARERYLAALRAADARDFAPLLAFVRSGG